MWREEKRKDKGDEGGRKVKEKRDKRRGLDQKERGDKEKKGETEEEVKAKGRKRGSRKRGMIKIIK